jgi:ribosomal protein S18 acetylase RimI-like enzyme
VIALRPLEPSDLPALLALQHAFSGGGARWTLAHLEAQLRDPGRAGGRNFVVADRGGAVVGGAGWVEAGEQMFGSPVLAADRDAARALVAHLVARARAIGALTLRCSTTPADAPKVGALRAAGFAPILDFITFARAAAPIVGPRLPLRRVAVTEIPLEELRDLYNETFMGVPNSPILDDEQVAHGIAGSWPDASGVWFDEEGAAAGFVIAMRERDGNLEHAVVDSVGVRAAWRKRGVGALAVAHLVSTAAAAGLTEVRALIASTNDASLRLHRGLGFAERSRISCWELSV